MTEKVYDAFISYSHRDLKWGKRLQRKLETYRIPSGVRAEKSEGHLHVFRDQTDLAGVELHESLQKALEASRYLIVLCSPAAAASRWVEEEIRAFCAAGGEGRVIPFIVAGEPGSDIPERECFPPSLREQAGRTLLGINIQEIGRNKAFLKLASILLDVRFDRLVDRHRRRRRRSVLAASAAAVLALSFAAGMLLRNAAITRENQSLLYDNYAAILLTFKPTEDFDGEDIGRLRASANAGNTQAMVLLADCFMHGWGTEEDPEEAFGWMKKAAEAGNVDAMNAMFNYSLTGYGTEADPAAAFEWSRKAAEAGNPLGMMNMGYAFRDGISVEKDGAQALGWFRRAAESGDSDAMFLMASCYYQGIGTEVDPAAAFSWMKRSAEAGNPLAMYNLALMYQEGFGTEEDPRQAYRWYRRCAETGGDADALYWTGWCIENHYGVDEPALDWYEAAAAAGNERAVEAVERLTGPRTGE